jgi:hypothetical protein
MKFINNGMFAFMVSKGEAVIVDGGGSDNNNEILGATSADGMPLMRDVAILERVRAMTAEGIPFMQGSPWHGEVVEDLGSTEVAEEDMNGMGADEQLDNNNFDDVDVDVSATSTWGPLGGVVALEGFVYIGKLSFLCFGLTTKYFAGTLAMGGQSDCSAEEKKSGSRQMQCRVNIERDNLDREVGRNERGLTMQSKIQCAFMA